MNYCTRKLLGLTDKNLILSKLLSYDIQLKITHDAVQYLHYYRKKKDAKSFFQQIANLDKRLPL